MSFKQRLPNTIILKAQKRDQFALTHIYHQYKSAIYGLAYRITQDRDASEDILQQVIEKVILKINALKEPEKFNGWLKTLSYRVTIDYLNKSSKNLDTEFDIDSFESQSFETTSLDIEKYLAVLNSRERLVLNLFLVEGYKHQEIAEKIGISEVNSKQIYRRSLQKLNNLSIKASYSGVGE